MSKVKASTWVKLAVAAAAVVFVAWVVPWRDRCTGAAGSCEPGLRTVLSHADARMLAALAGVYAAGTLAWALRWHRLLDLAGAPLSRIRAWRVATEAQAGGILLPGGVGGDALRIAAVRAHGVGVVLAAGTVLLDRMLGLATLGTVAGVLGLLDARAAGPAALVVASFPVGFVAAIVLVRLPAVRGAGLLQRGRLGALAKPLLEYVGAAGAPRAIALAAIPSLVSSAVHLTMLRGLVQALGAPPADERQFVVGAALALAATAVPAVPGGWGTSEAAFVVLLGRSGVSPSAALGTALLYRLYWYAYGLLGAALSVAGRPAAR